MSRRGWTSSLDLSPASHDDRNRSLRPRSIFPGGRCGAGDAASDHARSTGARDIRSASPCGNTSRGRNGDTDVEPIEPGPRAPLYPEPHARTRNPGDRSFRGQRGVAIAEARPRAAQRQIIVHSPRSGTLPPARAPWRTFPTRTRREGRRSASTPPRDPLHATRRHGH